MTQEGDPGWVTPAQMREAPATTSMGGEKDQQQRPGVVARTVPVEGTPEQEGTSAAAPGEGSLERAKLRLSHFCRAAAAEPVPKAAVVKQMPKARSESPPAKYVETQETSLICKFHKHSMENLWTVWENQRNTCVVFTNFDFHNSPSNFYGNIHLILRIIYGQHF